MLCFFHSTETPALLPAPAVAARPAGLANPIRDLTFTFERHRACVEGDRYLVFAQQAFKAPDAGTRAVFENRLRAKIAVLRVHCVGLKDELDGEWAVQLLELVRDGSRAMLVLKDAGGELLDRLLGAPMEGTLLPPCLAEPWRFQNLRGLNCHSGKVGQLI
jgi:hypothetical protein